MLSTAAWWRDAGVDTLVDDEPRNWLGSVDPTPSAAPAPAADVHFPATIPLFGQWLAQGDVPLAGPTATRLAPAGDPAAGLMVIIDMPEPGDAAAGRLMAGDVGLLFDRMLAAIGRDRESIYLASLAVSRTADGRIDAEGCRALGAVACHHIALAAPRAVLLMGDCVAQAVLGSGTIEARGALRRVNQGGANTACVATFHPRFLQKHPAAKPEAWRDLQLLLGELSR